MKKEKQIKIVRGFWSMILIILVIRVLFNLSLSFQKAPKILQPWHLEVNEEGLFCDLLCFRNDSLIGTGGLQFYRYEIEEGGTLILRLYATQSRWFRAKNDRIEIHKKNISRVEIDQFDQTYETIWTKEDGYVGPRPDLNGVPVSPSPTSIESPA